MATRKRPSKVTLDEPLTFPAAAKAIGWKPDKEGDYRPAGRRLLRLARRREKESKEQFLVRDRAGRPVKVTLGALSRHLPECMPSRVDTLAASLKPLLETVEQRARDVVDEQIALLVDPELQRLHTWLARLERDLSRALKALDKR